MSVFSNNRFLKRVNPEIVRAKDDSGSSLEHPEIQQLMRQMVDLGIADNLKLWVHNGLVKTRTSGSDLYVPKAYDISGEENDAVQETEANQPELVSNGMEFDGSNDMMSPGSVFDPGTGPLTIVVWIRIFTFSGYKQIFGNRNSTTNPRVWLGTSNESIRGPAFIWRTIDIGGSSAASYGDVGTPLDEWYFVSVTRNGTSNTLRLNDGSRAGGTNGGGSVTSGEIWRMMQRGNVHQDGVIGELRLFDQEISSDDEIAIYNQTKSKYGHT